LLRCVARQEETESDSVKAEKARARAHRDKLAQMALERRAKKAEIKAEADALAALQVCVHVWCMHACIFVKPPQTVSLHGFA